jgi:phosphoglycerol transferase MdoB-like AlkP superfamily enzyme
LVEAVIVLFIFYVVIPKALGLKLPVDFLKSPSISLLSCSLLLTLTVLLSFFHKQIWMFNLEKNSFLTLVASSYSARSELNPNSYDFKLSPGLTLVSKYEPDSGPQNIKLPQFSIKDHPNVILFVMESAGARHMKSYGGHFDSTPNFDSLKGNSIFFNRAYGHSSDSANSVLPNFCSLYPYPSKGPDTGIYSDLSCDSLQTILKSRGYSTAMLSRWDSDFMGTSNIYLNNGVDLLYFTRLRTSVPPYSTIRSDEDLIKAAVTWASSQSRPFFLTIWPTPAHSTGTFLTPSQKRFGEADFEHEYQNRLLYQDFLLGMLIQGLKEHNLLQSCLLAMIGDHGEGIGRVGTDYAHSNFLYEDVARVPFMIYAPSILNGPLEIPSVAQQIDLIPTLLGLLGLGGNYRHQGHDLSKPSNQRNRIVYMAFPATGFLALIDYPWKLIYQVPARRDELFNLESDPFEHRNLAETEKDKTTYYRILLQSWALYQQGYYEKLGVFVRPNASGPFSFLSEVPVAVQPLDGDILETVHAGDGKPLYGFQGSYSDAIAIAAGANATFKLGSCKYKYGYLQFELAVEYPCPGKGTMPWLVDFKRDGSTIYTALLQNYYSKQRIELLISKASDLTISIHPDSPLLSRPGKAAGRIILGNPKIY